MTAKKPETIAASLGELEEIVRWFDDQEAVDVEEGIERVRRGAALIKDLRGKLKNVENEFVDIKQSLVDSA